MNLIGMARNEVQLSRIKVTLKVLFRFGGLVLFVILTVVYHGDTDRLEVAPWC